MRKFDVIIPMYNEVGRIESTLLCIKRFLDQYGEFVGKIVLVDDASTDRTVEWCRALIRGMPVELVCRASNGGKWAAIRTGLSMVRGRVLLLDADGSASIFNMLDADDAADVIVGTRFGPGAVVVGKGLFRSVVSQGYRVWVQLWYWWAGGIDRLTVMDVQCPFKLFDVRDLDVSKLSVDRFAGDVELMLLLSRVNSRCQNLPVLFEHRRGSKVRPSSVGEMMVDTVRVARRFRRDRKVY